MIGRLDVSPGRGTVIRYGGIVAWADASATPALISFLAQSARNLGTSPQGGEQIADHIAGVLVERDPEPSVAFAVVGPGESGWAVLLHGPVQLWDGVRWLVADQHPGWLCATVVPQPSLAVNSVGSQLAGSSPEGLGDLESGVVPGSGFVMAPSVATSLPQQPTPERVPERVREPTAVPADALGAGEATQLIAPPAAEADPTTVVEAQDPTTVLPAAEHRAEPPEMVAETVATSSPRTGSTRDAGVKTGPHGSVDLRKAREAGATIALPPLPLGRGPDRTVPGAPVVAGVLCPRGHLNRPGISACVRCSVAIPEEVSYGVSGTRPALGILVVDDGSMYRLDRGYLAGSDPAADPTVRGALALPLVLAGGDTSPADAEVRLHDWDVVVTDRASASGTCVFEPGADKWERLAPYEARIVAPGTHIAFGQRIVTFVTPWVARELPADA